MLRPVTDAEVDKEFCLLPAIGSPNCEYDADVERLLGTGGIPSLSFPPSFLRPVILDTKLLKLLPDFGGSSLLRTEPLGAGGAVLLKKSASSWASERTRRCRGAYSSRSSSSCLGVMVLADAKGPAVLVWIFKPFAKDCERVGC